MSGSSASDFSEVDRAFRVVSKDQYIESKPRVSLRFRSEIMIYGEFCVLKLHRSNIQD